ncbi:MULTISPECIES: hypothetical protein [Gordonia]|uniref:hypothetical protein n=1 Tax=Gordonia sp. McavH-238-E TaxID=2917736 RepID=UPI001EF4D213|nr:hypothetical protein [Gordonia sp. McavH-238-E]MCG7631021.1 hypothetical protein [Gordonia sp. McavH-238-E]
MMQELTDAVALGREGETARARERLLALWETIGVDGDALHRCTLAHHLADLYKNPADSLAWDVRALDAAHALTDGRVRSHHAELSVAGFLPSLHLNLADDHRRLGSFDSARRHLAAAARATADLPEGPYGRMIRGLIKDIDAAVERRDTTARQSHPGMSGSEGRAG